MGIRKLVTSMFLFAFIIGGIMFAGATPTQAATNDNAKLGAQGAEVVKLQQTLNYKGFWCGEADGVFDAQTHKAVVAFQKSAGLKTDGIAGARTKYELGIAHPASKANSTYLFWGSRGPEVAKIQQALNSKGFTCGTADGIFGPLTYNAVERFQKAAGIIVNGIVGPETRKALETADTKVTQQNNAANNVENKTTAQSSTREAASNVSRSGSSRGSYTLTMKATAYCPCAKCNYPYYGKPSYIGLPLGYGIVAVDPRVIPMGSKLYIEGYGHAIAADQGGAIKGNRIDLCFSSHQEALRWGMKNVKVTVIK
ncbi:MAG TPA: hypothetical protein GX404_00680 [Syntrophomonadaceae bacterium]|nr:hypothetical protein [Syntrophomonadaceae bacterium]